MNCAERFDLIIKSEKFSNRQFHDVGTMLCYIRDCPDTEKTAKMEKLLQAFIVRARLGEEPDFKKMRIEFGLWTE